MWTYRFLLGTIGAVAFAFGLALVFSFFVYQWPLSTPAIPTGPVGYYFVAFTGCALIGWGAGLIGAARAPETSRTIATVSAWLFALMAVVRMTAWVSGDYAGWLGDLPRFEAAVLLVLAMALVWLRPESGTHQALRRDAAAHRAPGAGAESA